MCFLILSLLVFVVVLFNLGRDKGLYRTRIVSLSYYESGHTWLLVS